MTINKQATELLIANGELVADTLRHLADNIIDSDYFAIVSTSENGTEIEHELAITDYALQAAGTVDELVRALEAAEKRIAELEAREIALPPRAPENLGACLYGYDKWVIATTFRDTWNACLSEVVRVNAAVISTDSAIEELEAAGIITKVGE